MERREFMGAVAGAAVTGDAEADGQSRGRRGHLALRLREETDSREVTVRAAHVASIEQGVYPGSAHVFMLTGRMYRVDADYDDLVRRWLRTF